MIGTLPGATSHRPTASETDACTAGSSRFAPALAGIVLASLLCGCQAAPSEESRPPNFVVIFADDLGWGDLGSYGHPSIRTPYLDRLAREGQRWTSFYAGASVCSPSRAALLTGREPVRSGLFGYHSRVLFPGDPGGMPEGEVTLAEALRERGYRTAIVGKWHLGDRPEYLPTRHGFDYWFGLPYSNDMDWTLPPEREVRVAAYFDPKIEYWNVPLHRSAIQRGTVDDQVLERPADQTTLTRRYTEEAVAFIEESASQGRPFFLYLAHSMVHTPLFRSPEFEGHSEAGIYGDVVEEIDDGVGRILASLERLGIDTNTLVVFTSDNGPWTIFRQHGGSAGPFHEGKGTTWEGGMRVPGLFWWPGTIRPATVSGIGSVLDLFPTLVSLSGDGGSEGAGPVLDGVDLSPTLLTETPSPRRSLTYYRQGQIYAYRRGRFKIHLVTEGEYGQPPLREEHVPPLLFDLGSDPGERYDLSAERPEVVEQLLEEVERERSAMVRAEPLFDLSTESSG